MNNNTFITIVGAGCSGLFAAARISERLRSPHCTDGVPPSIVSANSVRHINGGTSSIVAANSVRHINGETPSVQWRSEIAATEKYKILLIEKTGSLGNKLLLSASGQCNFTNIKISPDTNPFPLYKNFLSYSDIISYFEERGIHSYIRDDGKVFPKSMKASDIKNLLEKTIKMNQVSIALNSELIDINYHPDNIVLSIKNNNIIQTITTKYLLLCTGGASYPKTGSTGDIINLMEKLNIKTIPFKPALSVPIVTCKEFDFSNSAGVSISNASVSLIRNNRIIRQLKGNLLFTHTGISGPIILNNSRHFEQGDKLVLYLTKSQQRTRRRIITNLSSLEFHIESLGDINEAMCSSGGICFSEINRKKMCLKKYPNIFVAGECVDFDGDTGGYNIHFAFATADIAVTAISDRHCTDGVSPSMWRSEIAATTASRR